jgi:F1F0 ATPase subunit 2
VSGLAIAFAVGLVIGLFFFGGLRFTVSWLTSMRSSVAIATLAVVSVVGRTGVAVAGFIWVGAGEWQRYLAALVGFLVMRVALVRLWGPDPEISKKE